MNEEAEKLREAIECCRPGSDDLLAPEMTVLAQATDSDPQVRAAYERTQSWDARVAELFRELPVPEGLEERLQARLAWEGEAASADLTNDDGRDDARQHTGPGGVVAAVTEKGMASPGSPEDVVRPAEPSSSAAAWKKLSRYSSFVVAPALVVVLIVGVILLNLRSTEPDMLRDEFCKLADSALSTAIEEGGWDSRMDRVPASRGFPADDLVSEPVKWRSVPVPSVDKRAVAYLLSDRIGAEAALLVADSQREIAGLKPTPPRSSLPTSGEQSLGAWQAGDLYYVLIVKGPNHPTRYRENLRELGKLAGSPRKIRSVYLIGKL